MNRFFLVAAIPALLFPGLASAADLSGTWRGVIEVNHGGGAPTVNAPVRLRLKQKGNALTGDIGHEGADMKPVPIQSGRIDGNEIYFEASSEETNGPIRFRLKLEGKRLTGQMRGAVEQGPISGRVDLTPETDRTP
jgi:hypothetical protein